MYYYYYYLIFSETQSFICIPIPFLEKRIPLWPVCSIVLQIYLHWGIKLRLY